MSVDLDRVRALLAAATPGPWAVGEIDRHGQETPVGAPGGDSRLGYASWHQLATCYGSADDPRNGYDAMAGNASLIAAAPALLAALIEELAAARAELHSIRGSIAYHGPPGCGNEEDTLATMARRIEEGDAAARRLICLACGTHEDPPYAADDECLCGGILTIGTTS